MSHGDETGDQEYREEHRICKYLKSLG